MKSQKLTGLFVKSILDEGGQTDVHQSRLAEEMEWAIADPGRECLIVLLHEMAAAMREAGIVVSPGYSFLPDSYLLYLTGVTCVNPIEWNLPFSRFTRSVHNGAVIPFEAGSGCIDIARDVFARFQRVDVTETKAGFFEIRFTDGALLKNISIHIIPYAQLDQFGRTIKHGWSRLNDATLALFRRGATDGAPFFESDKMREWLFGFEPESMSDLVLLNAIFWPRRLKLFSSLLDRKRRFDASAGECSDPFDETYGLMVYQEQIPEESPREVESGLPYELAPKGHFVGRTMMAVEALVRRSFNSYDSFKMALIEHLARYNVGGPGYFPRFKRRYAHIVDVPEGCRKIDLVKRIIFSDSVNPNLFVKPHPCAHHLNSSQVVCYEFFRPLISDDKRLESGMLEYLSSVGIPGTDFEGGYAEFEWEPCPEENTNFDFYVYKNDFKVYFEIKYTECGFGACAGDDEHRDKYDNIYKKILEDCACLRRIPENFDEFRKYYQLFRNVLRITKQNWQKEYVVFLFPRENTVVKKQFEDFCEEFVAEEYRSHVLSVYWEDMTAFMSSRFREKFFFYA